MEQCTVWLISLSVPAHASSSSNLMFYTVLNSTIQKTVLFYVSLVSIKCYGSDITVYCIICYSYPTTLLHFTVTPCTLLNFLSVIKSKVYCLSRLKMYQINFMKLTLIRRISVSFHYILFYKVKSHPPHINISPIQFWLKFG